MSRQAKRSARLAATVANKLAAYDTEGVKAALEKFCNVPGHDTALATSLHSLVDNLERYRPHLPAWVLPTDVDHVDAGKTASMPRESGGDDDVDDDGLDSVEREMREEDERGDDESVSDGDASDGTDPSSASMNMTTTLSVGDSVDTNSTIVAPTPNALVSSHGWGHRNNAAVALIGFRLADTSSEAMKAFVVTVQAAVRETHGVVHGCVNSTLSVSWGAATSTGRPELALARCFVRLRTALAAACLEATKKPVGGRPLCSAAWGAGFTGPVEARLTGDDRHQLLVIDTPTWHGALDRLFAFASRHEAFVVDSATSTKALLGSCCCADELLLPPNCAQPHHWNTSGSLITDDSRRSCQ